MKLRIRELREDRGLRQIDVAEATGIDQKTLSNYETGKTLPDVQSMCNLADFFNVSLDYLSGRSDYNIKSTEKLKKIFGLAQELSDEFDKLKK